MTASPSAARWSSVWCKENGLCNQEKEGTPRTADMWNNERSSLTCMSSLSSKNLVILRLEWDTWSSTVELRRFCRYKDVRGAIAVRGAGTAAFLNLNRFKRKALLVRTGPAHKLSNATCLHCSGRWPSCKEFEGASNTVVMTSISTANYYKFFWPAAGVFVYFLK